MMMTVNNLIAGIISRTQAPHTPRQCARMSTAHTNTHRSVRNVEWETIKWACKTCKTGGRRGVCARERMEWKSYKCSLGRLLAYRRTNLSREEKELFICMNYIRRETLQQCISHRVATPFHRIIVSMASACARRRAADTVATQSSNWWIWILSCMQRPQHINKWTRKCE